MQTVGLFWRSRLYWKWPNPHSYYDPPTYVFIHLNAMFSCSYGRLISSSQMASAIGPMTQGGNRLYERYDLLMCLNTNITSVVECSNRQRSDHEHVQYLRALGCGEQSDRWSSHICNSSEDIVLKAGKWKKWMAIHVL